MAMASNDDTRELMATRDLRVAINWQADHAEKAFAPTTARVIRAELELLATDTETARRMNDWPGRALEDAMPLRIAGALHWLVLSGTDERLRAVYSGEIVAQEAVDALVIDLVQKYDSVIAPWLDGPPQTNEAGRSASIMAGLLWLSARLGPKFELNEMGASAGVNTMMERYHYDLGGVQVGPADSPMQISPEWRGPPPPDSEVEIVAIRGADLAPVNLSDPAQALRLKAYVWADAVERMGRIDAAVALAGESPPDLARMDAADFVRGRLGQPQEAGVTRVLYHSVVWQYLPQETRSAITAMMEQAGAEATRERPLAWVKLETNRETFRHELSVHHWPGGEEWVTLGEAHPHGAWIEWLAQG